MCRSELFHSMSSDNYTHFLDYISSKIKHFLISAGQLPPRPTHLQWLATYFDWINQYLKATSDTPDLDTASSALKFLTGTEGYLRFADYTSEQIGKGPKSSATKQLARMPCEKPRLLGPHYSADRGEWAKDCLRHVIALN